MLLVNSIIILPDSVSDSVPLRVPDSVSDRGTVTVSDRVSFFGTVRILILIFGALIN